MIFSILFYTSIPAAYKKAGVSTDNLWHRVWISLGIHPEWPFQEMKEKYIDCTGFVDGKTGFVDGKKGLHSGIIDPNGWCVWSRYLKQHDLNLNPMANFSKYEELVRNEFFKVVFHYPLKVFMTFFYYKPLFVYYNMQSGFNYSNPTHKLTHLIAPIISGFILLLSWFFYSSINTLRSISTLFSVLLLLILSTMSMYIVAWGGFNTILEFIITLHIFAFICLMTFANTIMNLGKRLFSKYYGSS
jgi:hypothetical protein